MCLRTSPESWGVRRGQGTAYPGSCRGSRPWRRAWRSQGSLGAASRAHSGVREGLTSPSVSPELLFHQAPQTVTASPSMSTLVTPKPAPAAKPRHWHCWIRGGLWCGLTSLHSWAQTRLSLQHSHPFLHRSGAQGYGVALWGSLCCAPMHSWWLPDIYWEQSVFHHFLNAQIPDSSSHIANQTFPPNLPFQAQTSGTSVGVNKSYLVNHARFQFFFCDIIMAPLLVLQKTQTTQRECSCSCTQCIYGWTTNSNAGIQDWSQARLWLWFSHADYNLHFLYFLSIITSKVVSI